jgi:hypothetical protein
MTNNLHWVFVHRNNGKILWEDKVPKFEFIEQITSFVEGTYVYFKNSVSDKDLVTLCNFLAKDWFYVSTNDDAFGYENTINKTGLKFVTTLDPEQLD